MLSINCRMSQKWETIFLENTFARFWDCRIIQSCIFLLDDFCPFLFLDVTRAYMVSWQWYRKSSANHLARVEFSQKCFVDLIFGHRFLSIFSKFFRVLCKSNRNITKLIYVIIVKKREHNGNMVWMGANSDFLAPKKT